MASPYRRLETWERLALACITAPVVVDALRDAGLLSRLRDAGLVGRGQAGSGYFLATLGYSHLEEAGVLPLLDVRDGLDQLTDAIVDDYRGTVLMELLFRTFDYARVHGHTPIREELLVKIELDTADERSSATTNRWRVTRTAPYPRGTPGHDDARARQGYYMDADTPEQARGDMARLFPHERPETFDIELWLSGAPARRTAS